MRHDAMPLRQRFAFSRVSRKEGKNDGLRKGLKKDAAVATFFFQKNIALAQKQSAMIGVPTRRMTSAKSRCCQLFTKGKGMHTKHDLGTSIAGVAS